MFFFLSGSDDVQLPSNGLDFEHFGTNIYALKYNWGKVSIIFGFGKQQTHCWNGMTWTCNKGITVAIFKSNANFKNIFNEIKMPKV